MKVTIVTLVTVVTKGRKDAFRLSSLLSLPSRSSPDVTITDQLPTANH
jgi:hypothetical protein